MTPRVAWVAASATLLAVTMATAQEPVFRSRVDLITVDATVIDGQGDPIPDLTATDFRLSVDGRPRRVVSAQFVAQTGASTGASALAARHFTSNEDANVGRLVVVAVDEAHIRRLEGREAMRAAGSFIDALAAADRVGVVGLTRLGALELTRDHLAAKRRLGALIGQTDPVFQQFNLGLSEALEIADGSRSRLADAVLRECGRALTEYISSARAVEDGGAGRDACPEQVEQESRAIAQHAHIQARISLTALESLLISLREIDGAKTLVLLSEGLVADPRRADLSKIAAAAQAARVAIYVLHLEVPTFEAAQQRVSPTFLRDLEVRGDGLARVAGAARGAVFRLVGSNPQPFQRIAREMSGYYLLAFEPLDTDRDGRAHRIQVSLARGGGQLRARHTFTLPAGRPSAQARADRLLGVLRSQAIAAELPLRVATYSYLEPDSANTRIVVAAEVEAASRQLSAALLGFVLVDRSGVIAASAVHDAVAGRYAFSAVVPAGFYTLRVAGIDALDRPGSVERTVDARVARRAGVQVSDLILAPPPTRPNAPLDPVIDHVRASALVAYLEMHAGTDGVLPDAVRVVISDQQTELLTIAANVTDSRRGWAVARAVVPLTSLSPGRYLARAELMLSGKSLTTVSRSFLIPDP
ncbi:MAG TPA: VWA domain-containing protein [Vicinamibacterales bacterium]|nr:VWA domain-containing protein [Vicinamibacterales bacterium]